MAPSTSSPPYSAPALSPFKAMTPSWRMMRCVCFLAWNKICNVRHVLRLFFEAKRFGQLPPPRPNHEGRLRRRQEAQETTLPVAPEVLRCIENLMPMTGSESLRYPVDKSPSFPWGIIFLVIAIIICAQINCFVEQNRDSRRLLRQRDK